MIAAIWPSVGADMRMASRTSKKAASFCSVDLLQLDIPHFALDSAERFGVEEIRTSVVGAEELFLGGRDDGRQLVEVADEDDLHAAERRICLGAIKPQGPVDAIKEIRPRPSISHR